MPPSHPAVIGECGAGKVVELFHRVLEDWTWAHARVHVQSMIQLHWSGASWNRENPRLPLRHHDPVLEPHGAAGTALDPQRVPALVGVLADLF